MIKKLHSLYTKIKNDNLYKNTFLLMLNSGIQAGLGFCFWTVTSRVYGPETVGVMGSIVTSATFVLLLGYLGFDYAIIKYVATITKNNKGNVLSMALNVVLPVVLFLSSLYILLVPLLSKNLDFLHQQSTWAVLFVIFVVMSAFTALVNSALLANRLTKFIVIGTVTTALVRLLLVVIHPGENSNLGLMELYVFSVLIGFIFSAVFLKINLSYKHQYGLRIKDLKRIVVFNLNNYIASIANSAAGLLLPTIILALLGAKQAAFFYVANLFVGVLNMIPLSTAQSFYAETSWREHDISELYRKSLKSTMTLMIPLFLLLVILGRPLLGVFGAEYISSSYITLVVLAGAALVQTVSYISATLLRATDHVIALTAISVIALIITLAFSAIGILIYKSTVSAAVGIFVAEISSALLFYFTARKILHKIRIQATD